MARYCTKCGLPAADDAAFCRGCGSAFALDAGAANQAASGPAQPPAQSPQPENASAAKKRNKPLIALAAGGGVLILGLLVLVAVLLGRDEAQPIAAPERLAAATAERPAVEEAAAPLPLSAARPTGFWALVETGQAQAYDVYTTHDTTVDRELGRALMAPGWKMYRDAYWDFQSVAEPVTLQSILVSGDGSAGIISRNGARFIEVQNGGALNLPDANSALGFPRRARMTPQQLIQELMPPLYEGIGSLNITSYERVEDGGRLLEDFTARLAEEIRAVQAAGNRVENIYCEYGVAKGTLVVDGLLCDFEAYIELEGYDGVIGTAAGEARLGIFGTSGITMVFAPPGSLAEYIPDMALMLYNSQLNSHWIDLRTRVSEYMLAQVNSGGLTHWADAWLYADGAIAAAAANVPDARDYTSYRRERINLEGLLLGAWEPGLERYRYASAADDLFTLDRPWAGVWYDGGTSLMVCALPDHTPDEVKEGYVWLTGLPD